MSPATTLIDVPPKILAQLRHDRRRIVILGASGWIGHTLIALLDAALGPVERAKRVHLFGSTARRLTLDDGTTCTQCALADLVSLPPAPTMLFHLAFLTKDKVAGMDAGAYCTANRQISAMVSDALDTIGVDRLFVASSGAAAFANDPTAADDLRLYGALKREDEDRFAAWAHALPETRRAAICRIYAVSGPWMNKHTTYALASFILDALAGRPIAVRAPRRVVRSYVAVRELLSVIMAMLLADVGDPVQRLSTGGEPLELEDIALTVAHVLGGCVARNAVTDEPENRYVGDRDGWLTLLERYGFSHLPLELQIAETAAWLSRQAGEVHQTSA